MLLFSLVASAFYVKGYLLFTAALVNSMAGYQYYFSRPDTIWRGLHHGLTHPLVENLQQIRSLERVKIQELKARAYFDVGAILNILHKSLTLLSIIAINSTLIPDLLTHHLIPSGNEHLAGRLRFRSVWWQISNYLVVLYSAYGVVKLLSKGINVLDGMMYVSGRKSLISINRVIILSTLLFAMAFAITTSVITLNALRIAVIVRGYSTAPPDAADATRHYEDVLKSENRFNVLLYVSYYLTFVMTVFFTLLFVPDFIVKVIHFVKSLISSVNNTAFKTPASLVSPVSKLCKTSNNRIVSLLKTIFLDTPF